MDEIKPKLVVEAVQFNGITFRRYPESPRRSDRVYFKCQSKLFKQGIRYLHREIWKSHNGPIPDGFHIHHKDGNTLNNSIENLEMLTRMAHLSGHWTDEKRERARNNAAKIRPLTKAWHASPEGREWHKQHAVNSILKSMKPKWVKCIYCEVVFLSKRAYGAKYCNPACRQRYYSVTKRYHTNRVCVVCLKEFTSSSKREVKFCSQSCSMTKRMNERPTLDFNCKICGSSFQSTRPDAMYCGKKCSQKAFYLRHK